MVEEEEKEEAPSVGNISAEEVLVPLSSHASMTRRFSHIFVPPRTAFFVGRAAWVN